jgi:N utilization substance protein B
MKRRRAREYALQMLFQLDFGHEEPTEGFFERFWRPLDEKADVKEFAQALVLGTRQRMEEIDAVLAGSAEHWVLERMAVVDRNILRAALYELLYKDDIPPAVAINEAIEIAKKFSMKESASFINGILDRVAKLKKKTKTPE